MTTKTQFSNSNVSDKKLLDVQVELLYDKKQTKAFKVHIKEGKFIVIDYKDRFGKNPDTEIFWETSTFQLLHFKPEYKIVNRIIDNFLKKK